MSNSPEFHQITLMVGGLKQAVETMTSMWQSQEAVASEGRRQVHLKIDKLKDEVANLSVRVNQMSTDIAIIKPDVEAFNDEKLRSEGAKRLGMRLWAAITAVAGGIGYGAHEVIARLFPPH